MSQEIIALEDNREKRRIKAIKEITDFKTLEYLVISDSNVNIQKRAYERLCDLFSNRIKSIKEYILKNLKNKLRRQIRRENEIYYWYYFFGKIFIKKKLTESWEIEDYHQRQFNYYERKIYGDNLDYRRLLRKIRNHSVGIENSPPEDYPIFMWSKYHYNNWCDLEKVLHWFSFDIIPKGVTHIFHLQFVADWKDNAKSKLIWYRRAICKFKNGSIKIINLKRKI